MRTFSKLVCVVLCIGFGKQGHAQLRLDSVAALHGNGSDVVTAMTGDRDRNIYVTGRTTSFDLATPGAWLAHRASSSIYAVELVSGKSSPVMLPSGATLQSVAADPRQNGTLYLSTYIGLFKTTDSGNTWTPLTGGLPAMVGPYTVAVAPSNPSIIYALFGARTIFRSIDAGLTWVALSPPPPMAGFAGVVAVDPANPAHVLLYGSQTDDGGATWAEGPKVLWTTFDPLNSHVVYAVSGDKLVKSTDGGKSFAPEAFSGVPGRRRHMDACGNRRCCQFGARRGDRHSLHVVRQRRLSKPRRL